MAAGCDKGVLAWGVYDGLVSPVWVVGGTMMPESPEFKVSVPKVMNVLNAVSGGGRGGCLCRRALIVTSGIAQ